MSTQSASNTGGGVLGRAIGRMAPFMTNPLMAAVAAPVVIGGTYAANRERNVNQPRRIGSQMGGTLDFDAMSGLSDRQKNIMSDWDEKQVAQWQGAIEKEVTNAVRLGTMTPAEARAKMEQANFSMKPAEITNSGQIQMGAMTAADLPDATSYLGDYNGIGLDDEYNAQLRTAAALQGNLTEDMGDQMISREFDRTARYRLPLENYRDKKAFAYQEKGLQNQMKRDMASNLLTGYANTAQQLMTSGL